MRIPKNVDVKALAGEIWGYINREVLDIPNDYYLRVSDIQAKKGIENILRQVLTGDR